MSANVAILPTAAAVDAAWHRYCALARSANADRRMWEDREHVQRMILAHEDFKAVFLACEQGKRHG